MECPPPPEGIIFDWPWEDMWFPLEGFSESLSAQAEAFGLAPLHREVIPEEDVELRLWREVSFEPPRLLIVRRRGGEWSSLLFGKHGRHPGRAPVGGWDQFWSEFLALGLFTMENRPPSPGVLDGSGWSLEANLGGRYRMYSLADDGPADRSPEHEIISYLRARAGQGGLERG